MLMILSTTTTIIIKYKGSVQSEGGVTFLVTLDAQPGVSFQNRFKCSCEYHLALDIGYLHALRLLNDIYLILGKHLNKEFAFDNKIWVPEFCTLEGLRKQYSSSSVAVESKGMDAIPLSKVLPPNLIVKKKKKRIDGKRKGDDDRSVKKFCGLCGIIQSHADPRAQVI